MHRSIFLDWFLRHQYPSWETTVFAFLLFDSEQSKRSLQECFVANAQQIEITKHYSLTFKYIDPNSFEIAFLMHAVVLSHSLSKIGQLLIKKKKKKKKNFMYFISFKNWNSCDSPFKLLERHLIINHITY